jgi:hypothetical protein
MAALLAAALAVSAGAQTTDAPQQDTAPAPKGTVLFERHGDDSPPPDNDRQPMMARVSPDLTAAERTAPTITQYDLDAHLAPSAGMLTMRVRLTVRNDGTAPLTRLALQVSSALQWEAVALNGKAAAFAQQEVQTDADHTGAATEVVIALPQPLAMGATIGVEGLYSGTVAQSSQRLRRIGAEAVAADNADWDRVDEDGIRLRGFGNVLWYPVAAPPLFLGEGNALFEAAGKMKLREQAASVHLRLTLELQGEAPVAAYFCGRRRDLHATQDDPNLPVASAAGIATAEWAAAPLGFRAMSLFTIATKEEPLGDAEASSSSSSENVPATATPLAYVAGGDAKAYPRLGTAVADAATVLIDWLGAKPQTALTVIDNPGQPFQDGPLLLAPVDALASSDATPALTYSLAHAWVDTGQPWMDEGLAQFFVLQRTEMLRGREAALAEMGQMLRPLASAEPVIANDAALASASTGQPLVAARDEIFYRRKAAAVWWMLRDIVGEDTLKKALTQWLATPSLHDGDARAQAEAFQNLLGKLTQRDLTRFFSDWVLRDVGLPDLSIVEVTPRLLPAGAGHDSGWLVSVTVRNNGAAVADVPVTVLAGTFSTTRRMRIAGFASVTDRFLLEAQPTEVLVNDGSVPEVHASIHTRTLAIHDDKR